MLATGMRQIRYGVSVLTGRPFSTKGLHAIVSDLRTTLEEFGGTADAAAELLMVGDADTRTQEEVGNRRLGQAVRQAAARTAYYDRRFRESGQDPAGVTAETLADAVAVTPKSALKSALFSFVSDRSAPVMMAHTTGTTGVPAGVWFSRYELDVVTTIDALSEMLTGGLRPRHVVGNFSSSRSALPTYDVQRTSLLVGNGCLQIGIVDPRIAVERLAAPLYLPGKERQITHMVINPSSLGAIVQEVERGAWSAADFGLERIFVGGEIMTQGLRERAREALGAPVLEAYSTTEITPVAGQVCTQDHLHVPPHHGFVEIIDPVSQRPAAAGHVGVLVVTPYPPFRDTTLLLRYDTGDLVRRLPDGEKLTCELRGAPAMSQVLGRTGTSAGPLARDILEVLQGERAIPLPTRYALDRADRGGADGVLYFVAPHSSPALLSRLEEGFARRGAALSGLVPVAEAADLPAPCQVRADLIEHSFELAPVAPAVRAVPAGGPAQRLIGSAS
jgi:phenylacetate-coenzyme A ligase PaaK-like adenylate-forming protein